MRDVALEEVADAIDYGVTASAQTAPVGPKMLRITDVQDGAVDWSTVPHCSVRTKKADKARLRPGDIVFARTGATTGKSFLIRDCPEGSVFASYLIRVRLSDAADPRYVGHFFRSAGYWAQITTESRGAAQPGVNSSKLKALRVPLPSIEEQRRIAAVLDAADALRAKRREALAKLDTLTQAIFIDMFGDPFDRSTPTQPMSELATIVMGQSPPGDSYNASGHGTPLLNGPTEFGAKYPQAVQWTTSPTRLSEPGDILFCVRGATAGRLNWSDGEYCLGRGLAAIRAPATRRDYIFRVLHAYYRHFQSAGVGSTFINISKKELHALPVPQTDEATASVFAARVGALDAQKALMESAAQSCADLFASLQQRAFRGEL